MWIVSYGGWRLEGSGVVSMRCARCCNTAPHEVWVVPSGPQLGLIFFKKPLLGGRKYFLVCPVCGQPASELSYVQAKAVK